MVEAYPYSNSDALSRRTLALDDLAFPRGGVTWLDPSLAFLVSRIVTKHKDVHK